MALTDYAIAPTDLLTNPSHAADHSALAKLLIGAPWVNVRGYGAVGDGVADDTAAIAAAVAAAYAASNGAYRNRAAIFYPPGVYKITSSAVLTPSAVTSIRGGVHHFGAGMHTSILRLVSTGSDLYFYDNVATPRSQFNSFTDLGFEGTDPAAFTAYTDISTNANGFRLWATSATGNHEQGFKFTRCRFFGLNNVFETAGDNTASENTFVQCRFDSIRGTMYAINNLQSFDHEFYGCDLVNLYGHVFSIEADGGGAVKLFGGNVIMQTGASASYFLRSVAGSVESPVIVQGTKFELLGNSTNLVNAGSGNRIDATFSDCKFRDTASVTKAAWVTIQNQSMIRFVRCHFSEDADYIKFINAFATQTQYGINGEILFESCALPVDWSDKMTVTGIGLISARDCIGDNISAPATGAHWAHDFDLHSDEAAGQIATWSGDAATLHDSGSPSHPQWVLKTAQIKMSVEDWPRGAASEATLKLPKNALIKSIHLRKPSRGGDGTAVTFRVGRNDKTGTDHAVSNTATNGPNTHAADVDNYFYHVGATANERTLRLYTNDSPIQPIAGGVAIVEYY